MLRRPTISVKALVLIGFVLLVAITYLYANSVTVVYGALELAIAALCYVGCLRRMRMVDGRSFLLCFAAVLLAWCSGLFGDSLKSTLLITVPLIMPLYISSLNITYKEQKAFVPVTILAVVVTYLAIQWQVFGEINSNTIGFMGFMGVSLGILWIKTAKYKVIPLAIVGFGFLCTMYSGSRNVAIVGLVCLAMLLLPERAFRRPTMYVVICAIVFGYSIFAEDIMAWAFSKPKLYELLTEFTGRYSDKAWEMSGRVDFLRRVQSMIAQRTFLQKLFGTGSLTTHGHNMFYQCVLNFGYIGTTLIYGMLFRVFKIGYKLIRKKQDAIVLGCVIILWGTILLQGADVFMIGPESYAVVPQVLMGIILHRYGVYRKELSEENPVEIQEGERTAQ